MIKDEAKLALLAILEFDNNAYILRLLHTLVLTAKAKTDSSDDEGFLGSLNPKDRCF